MSDIRAGDVVMCVDAAPRWYSADPHNMKVVEGQIYRVRNTGCGGATGEPCLHLWGIDRYHFTADRFRKIDAADELFTEQMRACRPAKQRVPIKARGESV